MSQNNVSIPKAELDAILQQNRELIEMVKQQTNQKEDGDNLAPRRPVQYRNVTIMFIDGKPVIALKNVGTDLNPVRLYEKPDPNDAKLRRLYADVVLYDPSTEKKTVVQGVDWMEFLQEGERAECRVLKSKDEQWVIEQGRVLQKQVKGYRTEELDIEVPLEITGVERYFVVDINGTPVEIFEDYVNMAKSSPRPEKRYESSGVS